MNIIIEQAKEEDLPLLKKLLTRARLDTSSLHWENFLVAKHQEEIVGCIQMKRYGNIQELGSMLVRKQYRHQGIGQTLAHYLLTNAIPPVYLMCPEHRQTYYEQFGFQVTNPVWQLPLYFTLRYTLGRIVGFFLKIKITAMRWDGPSNALQT